MTVATNNAILDGITKRNASSTAETTKLAVAPEQVDALPDQTLPIADDDATPNPSIKVAKPNSPLSLIAWSYTFEESNGSGNYRIGFALQNNSPKGIKLVDGSLQFYDLLDEHLYGIALERDVKIDASSIYKDSGLYKINQFIADDLRMKKMDREDVKAKLRIRKVVFEDNEILDLTK
jgi:hypothetical protein